jgi:hypothetical protein
LSRTLISAHLNAYSLYPHKKHHYLSWVASKNNEYMTTFIQ